MSRLTAYYRDLKDLGIKLRNCSMAISEASSGYRAALETVTEIIPNLHSDSQEVYTEMINISEDLYRMYSVLNRISEIYCDADKDILNLTGHLPDA